MSEFAYTFSSNTYEVLSVMYLCCCYTRSAPTFYADFDLLIHTMLLLILVL